MEAVLLSTPISYLKSKAKKGDKSGKKMLQYKEQIDKPLSAILSLNTVAHTIGAAGVGAQATVVFGEAYFGLVSAILTVLILIFTEIIPKTLGANYAKELVSISAKIMHVMIVISYPLVIASSFLTKLISRKKKGTTITREEVSILASIGTEEGIFAENENKIIQNLIKLKNIHVSEIMTPRKVVVTANENMDLNSFLENKDFLYHSRIPVYNEHKDNITGYVLRSVVFEKLAQDQFHLHLKDIKRQALRFNKKTTLFNAWDEMLAKREHISLITNEQDKMIGISTLEDIIESLLGFEIIDEKEKLGDLRQYALKRWEEKQRKYDLLIPKSKKLNE